MLIIIIFSITAYASGNNNLALKEQLENLIEQYDIPGAVLSYKVGSGPILTVSAGYASLETKRKMTGDDLFLVGSITKSFTSTLILHLVENKKVSLDDSLNKIATLYNGKIDKLVSKYPDLGPMSIRQLLNHTSGVPQSINTEMFMSQFIKNPHKYYSPGMLMEIAMTSPVYFKPPGDKGKWSYTNTDYVLAGLVIEDVTGDSIADNFQQLIDSVPLRNTYFANNGLAIKKVRHKIVDGYIPFNSVNNPFHETKIIQFPNNQDKKVYQLKNSYNIPAVAGSGIITTAPSLVKWYDALFTKRFIDTGSKMELIRSVPNGKYNKAGAGLGVATHTYFDLGNVVGHDGLLWGYSSVVMFFEEENLTLAIATNSSNDKVSTFSVYNGEIIPGLVTNLLPYIIKVNGIK